MNTSQIQHDEQTRSARDGPRPAREQPARLVPSSRYRHPGDVIRLIGAGLILIVSLSVVAVAPSQLFGTDASAVTWLAYDPAGLVQVAFVVAAAGIVAAGLRHRRFRLLASLAAGAMVAGGALAGIMHLFGGGHPPAVVASTGQDAWLTSAAFPGPALLASAVVVMIPRPP